MADDEDQSDSPLHAADEPTAVWGQDQLADLGLQKPPSQPPSGPAQPTAAEGSESSVQVSLGSAEDPHMPVGKPGPQLKGQPGGMLPWLLTLVGAILLAVVAFYVVRSLR